MTYPTPQMNERAMNTLKLLVRHKPSHCQSQTSEMVFSLSLSVSLEHEE